MEKQLDFLSNSSLAEFQKFIENLEDAECEQWDDGGGWGTQKMDKSEAVDQTKWSTTKESTEKTRTKGSGKSRESNGSNSNNNNNSNSNNNSGKTITEESKANKRSKKSGKEKRPKKSKKTKKAKEKSPTKEKEESESKTEREAWEDISSVSSLHWSDDSESQVRKRHISIKEKK
ncbi:hypothetical protein RFI_07220, partial [Reticulomyxa filosa]